MDCFGITSANAVVTHTLASATWGFLFPTCWPALDVQGHFNFHHSDGLKWNLLVLMSVFLILIMLSIFGYPHKLFVSPLMWVACYSLLIIFLKDYSPFPSNFEESYCILEILSLFYHRCYQYFSQSIICLLSVIFWDNKDMWIYNQICLSFHLWQLGYIRKLFSPQFYVNILLESFILFWLLFFTF